MRKGRLKELFLISIEKIIYNWRTGGGINQFCPELILILNSINIIFSLNFLAQKVNRKLIIIICTLSSSFELFAECVASDI